MSERKRGDSRADRQRALAVAQARTDGLTERDRLWLAQRVAVREAHQANENARIAAVGRYLEARAPIAPEPLPDSRWMD